MVIGLFPKARANAFRYLRWIPLERILAASSLSDLRGYEIYMFYAEAWALVHHLTLGRSEGASMSEALTTYLQHIELGMSPAAAFESAFGDSPMRVGRRIIANLEDKAFSYGTIPLSALEYDRTTPVARMASREEISLRLGQLRLAKGPRATDDARAHFESALAVDPRNARAHAGIGECLVGQDRWDEAEPYFRRAVDLDPEDALSQLDLAKLLHGRAMQEEAGSEARRARLRAARDAYQRSLDLDDSIPETWVQLGRSYLVAGEDASKSVEPIERAYRVLPSHETVVDSLAEAYLAVGKTNRAREVLLRRSARLGSADRVDAKLQEIRDRRAAENETGPDPDAARDGDAAVLRLP